MMLSVWLTKPDSPLYFFIRGNKSLKFLCVLGVLLAFSYLINAAPAFDDLYLPHRFSVLVSQYGYFKTIGVLFSGMDLPNEYRTYGLSRVLQFLIWSVGGDRSFLFPLFIALSQLGTAIALLHLARERGVDEPMSLAVATIWLISPFSLSWAFHHYSYQILPFQIVVVACWILGRVTTAPYRYFLATLLGIACALSGEGILLTGPLALLFIALASSDKARLRLSIAAIAAMMIALISHHWFWSEFIQDTSHAQRFEAIIGSGMVEKLPRILIPLASIPRTGLMSIKEILSSDVGLTAILIGGLLGLAYWWVTGGLSAARGASHTKSPRSLAKYKLEFNMALVFLGLAFSFLLVYLALSFWTGMLSHVMPRRYGFVPLTLLLIAGMIGIAVAFDAALGAKRLALAVFIGLIAALAGQLHLVAIPAARAADSSLAMLMKEAGGLDKGHTKTDKGVLFFVSSNAEYQLAHGNPGTSGPRMDGLGIQSLLESPFGTYWTAQHYSTFMLGFRFAAMPKSDIEVGTIEVGDSSPPIGPGRIPSEDVIVVANLGFDEKDPLGRNIRVFRNFAEFQPYYFGRQIKRNFPTFAASALDEFVIDMGFVHQVALTNPGAMPDKKFSESVGPIGKTWIVNYGLLVGQDSVYSNPDVSGALQYYRTNRNSEFTYGVTFGDKGMYEVCLDFWEQWGRRPGERVFELEVSWDGIAWASVGRFDIASLNQNEPVSILLSKANPKVFQFRMKKVAGSMDIPVIHGLIIHKL
jgi:hypothetical protein